MTDDGLPLFDHAQRAGDSAFYEIKGIPQTIVRMFEKLTFQVIATGRPRYSSDAVLHRIRWHMEIEQGFGSFKCNDHWTSYLSRWFMEKHPQHAGFFKTRKLGENHENYEFFAYRKDH